jgi:hypothetical protein
VLSWFTEGEEAGRAGLRVCRVKNKFGFAREELVGGYRDLMFCVIYEGPRPVWVVVVGEKEGLGLKHRDLERRRKR